MKGLALWNIIGWIETFVAIKHESREIRMPMWEEPTSSTD